MTQLIVPHTELAHDRFAEAIDRAQRRVLEPRAPNTQRVYRQAWRAWDAHCAARGLAPWPLHPAALVSYLEARTDLAPNTVRLHLSALCARDVELRCAAEAHPISLRRHPVVTRWLQSWSREHPIEPQRQAPALSRAQIDALLVAARERGAHASRPAHAARYARDRALLLFGLVGGFRGAELAGLEHVDVQPYERGLSVRIRRSKTDQHGRSRIKVLLPQGTLLRCPIDAWAQWMRLRGEWPGPAFVAINRDGALERAPLSADAIRRMVAARAAAAGLVVSSHSMRASCVTLARQRGASLDRIADHVGHRSVDTTRRYCRQLDAFADNPSAGMLDGD